MSIDNEITNRKIIDLYFNQHKTIREVCRIVGKSSRYVVHVIKQYRLRLANNNEQEKARRLPEVRAYKLFAEGKSPSEVAIALNIREPDVTQLYLEYWRLNQLYELDQIYEETKGNFPYLLELYRQMKAAGMTIAHIIRLLRVANKDLPSVEYRCQELRREEASLRAGNSNAARIFQEPSDSISDEYKTLNQYHLIRNRETGDR